MKRLHGTELDRASLIVASGATSRPSGTAR